jgi:pimeloyl-ACP methyl ester carboxylesterase
MRRAGRIAVAAIAAGALVVLARSSTRPAAPAAGTRHQAFRVDAGAVHLRAVRAGSGQTVVLLHGYGESLLAWRALFDELTPHADVLALDLRGFGLSDKPPTGYATDTLAADVIGVLESLGIERAVLVGHSLGGAIAAAAAARSPERVSGLILIAPAVVGARWEAGWEAAATRLRAAVAEYERLRPHFFPPRDPEWLREARAEDSRYRLDADEAYRVALQAVLREFDFAHLTAERAGRLTMPTWVLWGELDPLFPVSEGRRLAASLPSARFRVLTRSWHRPHVERPSDVAALVVEFLDTH